MSISFEGLESRLSPEAMEDRIISEAFIKAKERAARGRIQMEEFAEDYSLEAVKKDLERVERIKEDIKRRAYHGGEMEQRLGLILEEILAEQLELGGWMGMDVFTDKTSEFDDIIGGVDTVVEIHDSSSINYVALALDATYSDSKKLQKKLLRNRDEIDAGTLARLKYFKNSDESFKGKLSKIPRAAVGVARGTVIELAKLWIEGRKTELSNHEVQFIVMEEILAQLKASKDYAEIKGKMDLVKIYERYINLFETILNSPEKKDLRKKCGLGYRNDPVYKAVMDSAQNLATLNPNPKEVQYTPLADKMHNRWNVY